jgi:chromosome segregation ATPase
MATIIVKTATEFRDAHVTIEIRADQDEVQSVANVLDQAERAGKVPALEAQVRDLVAERDALLLKVRSYDHDRRTEKQRADENREWAERTEALLENVTTERDALRLQVENAQQEMTGASNKLAVVKNALTRQHEPHSKRVSEALNILG